ncbi:hypothetical protein M758_2G204400 [Ceratodon purpureus]|nr:hypothetical protein M758_2G204400 [Ceratodon purpureus]
MSDFAFDEGQLWSPYSDSIQFLSTAGACPASVLSDNCIIDSEMFDGLDTVMDDDACLEFLFNECQEFLSDPFPPIMGYEEPGDNHDIADAHLSTCAAIGIVFNPETNLVPSAANRSASVRCRWPNFVWLVCACNRFSNAAAAAAASLRAKVPQTRNVLKGVMKKKDKYVCEMRIMKKMQKEKNKLIDKVWLGTYKTEFQAARALDVGKFFFNSKDIKGFSNPNSETILSQLSYLLAQPLDELVKNVKKLAKHYSENDSLQNFVL